MIILKARSSALATTAGAIGWALTNVLVTTALFRWPVQAGQADATVTGTPGAVVSRLDGRGPDVDPGTAVASNVTESIFYRAWLLGNLGSPDSAAAERCGPELFKAGALAWQEAEAPDDVHAANGAHGIAVHAADTRLRLDVIEASLDLRGREAALSEPTLERSEAARPAASRAVPDDREHGLRVGVSAAVAVAFGVSN